MNPEPTKIIWIDLENSPHVPFFNPIITALKKRGYGVHLTARDCFQVCGLCDLYGLDYEKIGRHYGKNKVLKVLGVAIRALKLILLKDIHKSELALSHGSRTQQVAALFLGIPTLEICDYEHADNTIPATWKIIPEVMSARSVSRDIATVLKYPGIKEDVYVPDFVPDPQFRQCLELDEGAVLVTVRPPATEAHYHNPQSDALFETVINFLGGRDGVQMVVLPRNERQKADIQKHWPEFCRSRKVIIPEQVLDGLNLIWHSDLVVSGGGTMNREAAALGVPVYSIFRGRIGAIDQYLADTGRLILLASRDDVLAKLKLDKRQVAGKRISADAKALGAIMDGIELILTKEAKRRS